MLKGCIFDLDGTLCHSMALWRSETAGINWSDPAAVARVHSSMRRHYAEELELRAGVTDFLEEIKSRDIPCCIASATAVDVSAPLLEKSGLMRYMDFYVSVFDIGARKDKPDIYLNAAERLGVDPCECAVFEDSEYCARTAHDAGFFVVGVFDPTTAAEGHCENYSDVYIREFSAQAAELLPLSSDK